MTPAEWLQLVQSAGIPAAMLVAVGIWVAKYLLPALIKSFEQTIQSTRDEHARDRETFERTIKDVTESLKTRPCWWQQEHRDQGGLRQAGGGQ